MKLNKEKQTIIMIIVVVIAMALFAVLVKQSINSNKVVKQTPRVNPVNQNQNLDDSVEENGEEKNTPLKGEEEKDNNDTEKDLEKKIEFSDETLKLSFLYPSFLGKIKIEKKENSYFLMFGKDLFFVAINPNYEAPPRGSFFGDVGFDIDNKKYIEDYCENKENCTSFLNDNKILIVKHNFMDFDFTTEEGEKLFSHYYLYNPNTEYAGIVISPIRIENKYKDVDIDKLFNSIINSINFLN